MGTMVAAAPLLAGGPPGWILYAGVAVITVGGIGIIYMSSRSKTKEKAIPKATTDTIPCRTWSIKSNAQGTDIGGTTGSTIGALPVISPAPISILVGAANAQTTFAMLGNRQATVRAEAFAAALNWLSGLPANGSLFGEKSFVVSGMQGGIRFDLGSYGPTNNYIY